MLTQEFAVVRGEDDQGPGAQSAALEIVQEHAYPVVEVDQFAIVLVDEASVLGRCHGATGEITVEPLSLLRAEERGFVVEGQPLRTGRRVRAMDVHVVQK